MFEDVRDKVGLGRIAKPAVAGIVLLAVMVAAFAGHTLIDTATANDFAVVRADEEQAAENSAGQDGAAQTIFVHVAGSVRNPGIVKLEGGARVADAVEGAGGFADDARIDSVNLARAVQDGEQIVVLSTDAQGDAAGAAGAGGAAGGTGTAAAGAQGTSVQGANPQGTNPQGKVNVNTASESDLQALPGIGPSTAKKIVEDRASNGPFSSVDDLERVSGIGAKKLAAIADLVCV